MRLAVISDIHANLEALEAVLRDCETHKVDTIYCLGDVVGYGGDPSPCLKLVDQHCPVKLMGNHEYAALGLLSGQIMNSVAKESMDWTQSQLTDHDFSILADLEMDARYENLYFVHASPHEPDKWHYVLTGIEADTAFRSFDDQICFIGHSHLPMIFAKAPDGSSRQQTGHDFAPDDENRYIVNVGSVGQPRDNDPRGCYVTYDSVEREIEYHRVSYDIDLTQRKMARARLPQLLIDRLLVGR
ncbi:MAG: metallophosphoesterase family protein [Candidatus Zixiibacteriota bacterium]